MNLVMTCDSVLECSVKQLINQAPTEVWSFVLGILLIALIVCGFQRISRR